MTGTPHRGLLRPDPGVPEPEPADAVLALARALARFGTGSATSLAGSLPDAAPTDRDPVGGAWAAGATPLNAGTVAGRVLVLDDGSHLEILCDGDLGLSVTLIAAPGPGSWESVTEVYGRDGSAVLRLVVLRDGQTVETALDHGRRLSVTVTNAAPEADWHCWTDSYDAEGMLLSRVVMLNDGHSMAASGFGTDGMGSGLHPEADGFDFAPRCGDPALLMVEALPLGAEHWFRPPADMAADAGADPEPHADLLHLGLPGFHDDLA